MARENEWHEISLSDLNDPNRELVRLIADADENGWMVVGLKWTHPISVTLAGPNGVEVTIADEYGLNLREVVRGTNPPAPRQVRHFVESSQ